MRCTSSLACMQGDTLSNETLQTVGTKVRWRVCCHPRPVRRRQLYDPVAGWCVADAGSSFGKAFFTTGASKMIQPLQLRYHGTRETYIDGMFQSSSILRGRRRSSVFVLLPKHVRLLPITADGKAARWLNVGLKRWTNEKYTEQLDIGTPILHVQIIYICTISLPQFSTRDGSIRSFR